MYFPLLRARQNELLALRETVEKSISKNKVIPILEPVNEGFRDIIRCSLELNKVDAGYILIVNPQVGYLSRNQRKLDQLINELISNNKNIEFAYWLNEGSTIEQVTHFFDKYSEFKTSLIHSSSTKDAEQLVNLIHNNKLFNANFFFKDKVGRKYEHAFSHFDNVILEDCFNKLARNADYDDEEFFSDNVYNYLKDGYVGFGDYSIVGNSYSETGGPAVTAALHLTYEDVDDVDDEIWIKHFLSKPRARVEEDGSTLVSEALPKLVEFIYDHKDTLYISNACEEFIALYESGERTSLGKVKKISIKHHLELMNELLSVK